MTDALVDILTRPKILSDIDCVQAFYLEAIAVALNARFGTSLSTEIATYHFDRQLDADQREFHRAWRHTPGNMNLIAPDLDAMRCISAAHDAGYFVIVASGRPKGVASATANWLDRWGVKRNLTVLEGKSSKIDVASQERDLIWIDDDTSLWPMFPNHEFWHPRKPWTPKKIPKNVRVFDSWDQPLDWLDVT